jgi:glycosyltransferase involved in cell wall biosynthesis
MKSRILVSLRRGDELNILMVAARYFPYIGGTETHIYEVGRRLASKGYNITILTTMPHAQSHPPQREEVSEGMQIMRVKAWPPQSDYYIAPEVADIIKRGRWDIVHCQGCHTFVAPLAMAAAKRARIPYVVTFHTGGHSSGFRNGVRGIQWRLLCPLLAGASALIGVSHFEANYFRDLLHREAKQVVVIPNGAAMPGLLQICPEEAPRTLIVSVGRLERYKGHQRLIAAWSKVCQWRSEARLLILGAGPYEAVLRDLARKNGVAGCVEIRAIPANDRQEMARTLAQASLVTLLSEYEAHPVAVMEALALRRPVLVADTSGFKELVEQGLVRAIPLRSSPDEIALAVRQQIEEPLVPSENFILPSWDDCADRLEKVYLEVANNRGWRREVCVS